MTTNQTTNLMPNPMPNPMPRDEAQLREQAIRQWRKRRDFRIHLIIYLMVNALFVMIWAMNGMVFFWPIFLIVGWGIGVVANAYDAYSSDVPTEDQINRQMDRLRGRG